ncbi:MAG: alpha-amylase [Chitinophagaceae bacterium]|nr:MAG: alpha-amylase [Chitinophagaceae bacterium]
MTVMKKMLGFSLLLWSTGLMAQPLKPTGVYPTHWWAGMKNPKLQLMLYAPGAAGYSYTVDNRSVKLVKVNKAENPNYVFLDLLVNASAKPGTVKVSWSKGADKGSFDYELKARRKGNGTSYAQGVRSDDFIYFLMPDRFANGDAANDKIAHYKDQTLNRDSMYHRHGGDLQGVMSRLDYLKDLGATTLWMTPVLENDMPNRTEHGYAITNHYTVDERYGGHLAYKRLSDSLHAKGMKLIQDAVYNHSGLWHFSVQDPPMKDWLNQWPKFTQTTYKDYPLMDPYAAASDKKIMSDGWFTQQMPDLNHRNPYMANYLIQHAIWCTEEFGVDGWRIDTYIYNDLEFMNRCNAALLAEFPKLTMFGETWVHGTANQAFFVRNNIKGLKFNSNLPGATDFQTLFYGIQPALNQAFGWTEGVNKLYMTLANDFLYKDASNNVVFLDNHDMTRALSSFGDDVDKLKVALGWLLSTRGIPQLYYGTEVLMKGVSNPDGLVRSDFPGGWSGDAQNKFTAAGRTGREEEVFQWVRTIANYRKNSSALKTGALTQYVPKDWVYTYFRYDKKSTVMVIMNTSPDERMVDSKTFPERTAGFTSARNIVTGSSHVLGRSWKVPGKSVWILELGNDKAQPVSGAAVDAPQKQ